MSTIAPFLVGLVASGVGYAYLSRELVTSRNKIMLKHFNAEGVEPYYPPRRKVRQTLRYWLPHCTAAAQRIRLYGTAKRVTAGG